MLHRKAVIYVAIGVIVLLIYSKFNKKKIILYSSIALVVTLLLNGLGIYLFKPAESKVKYDYLSTRFQQLAAAVYYHPESFTKEELEFYDSTLGLENNKKFLYSEADPIKNNMKNENFKGKSSEFFKIWWKGYKLYPKIYIDAVLNLSVSYWYPYNAGDISYVSSYYYSMYKRANNWYENDNILDAGLTFNMKEADLGIIYNNSYLVHWGIGESSVFGIFYRAGVFAIGLVIILLFSLIRKNKDILPMVIFCFVIILTCIYSPIVNYFRYSYIYIMIIPLLLPMLFIKK